MGSQPASAATTADNQIIAAMRLVLAASALAIIIIDPLEPSQLSPLTYATLALYTCYSAALYLLSRHGALAAPIARWGHWLDVAWYITLIALSQGTSSIFFFLLFFAVLAAAFRHGFAAGLQVTIASAMLFMILGLATAPVEQEFELRRLLLRPTYLLVLGYMVSHWGGFEIALKRRLALLKELTTLSNPRFGVDRTTATILERLRTFYQANTCLSITIDPGTGEYRMRRTSPDNPEAAAHVELIPGELARQLLTPPAELALVYRRSPHSGLPWGSSYYGYDVSKGERTAIGQAVCEQLAATLDADSFASIPLYYSRKPFGRLYITASRWHAFHDSDADFLFQVNEHVTPLLDSIRLVDRLASDAADEERQRIARDLHDSIIQPYIGLQIGLAAVRQKLGAGADVSGDIERLYALTADGIADLRGYVHGLKSTGEGEGNLLPSLRRFAGRFAAATSIAVQIEAQDDVRVNDRLAGEVFQMVAEGLSNVRRHTQATRATVDLARRDDHLVVQIEDEGTAGSPPASFIPRSIAERAAALGGRASVERQGAGGTRVVIEIPL
jgi:signal transduction histidine kinase